MVCDDQAAVVGEARDFHGLGEAAAAGEVNLDDVNFSPVHQLEVGEPVALLFPRRDADRGRLREFPVAFVVVGAQGLFQPEDVEFLETDGALDGGLRVPHQAGVNQQVGVGAQALSRATDQVHIGLGIAAHGVPAEFHRLKPAVAEAARKLEGLLGRRAEKRAGVTAELLVEAPAEEFPDGQSERLALDVPERHVDAAHGVDADAPSSGVDVGAVHLVPKVFGLEGVFAQDDFPQARGRGVRKGAFDYALHGQRRGVHFADAGDARVGRDLHNERVLAAVALFLHLFLAEVNRFDAGDLHGSLPV